jgi:hypothetical protein
MNFERSYFIGPFGLKKRFLGNDTREHVIPVAAPDKRAVGGHHEDVGSAGNDADAGWRLKLHFIHNHFNVLKP